MIADLLEGVLDSGERRTVGPLSFAVLLDRRVVGLDVRFLRLPGDRLSVLGMPSRAGITNLPTFLYRVPTAARLKRDRSRLAGIDVGVWLKWLSHGLGDRGWSVSAGEGDAPGE